ncbi:MAG: hypothetical protein M3Y35_11815, partial [Actinomycetota bacterium]|nr:hypothetical protein [Actinomycetota bacterium]
MSIAEKVPNATATPDARPSVVAAVGRSELTVSRRMLTPAQRARSVVLRVIGLIVSILLVLFIIGPLIWLALGAFAKTWNAPSLLPQSWTFSWWKTVFSQPEL